MRGNILHILLGLVFILSSCELMNYDGPDAQFHGAIIDEETGDTILQDIIGGSVIDFIEQGYETPQIQRLIFKVDGTFRDNLMFSAEYKMIPIRGNFFTPDTVDIQLSPGDNNHDFLVLPYARIKDVQLEISNNGGTNYLVVHFKIEQLSMDLVKSNIIVMDKHPSVGHRINERFFEKNVGQLVDPDDEQILYMPLSYFTEGQEYYIRIGSLLDIPEAKYNWNKAIKLDPYTLPMP